LRNTYEPKTHVLCHGCGGKIFFSEAEVVETGSQRLLKLECSHKACSLHGKPVLYDEAETEIYGFFGGKGSVTGDVVSPAISLEDWGNLK
jgi:hypothetical protein